MEIEFADKKDLPQVMRLWNDCFFDTDDYMEMYFNHLYSEKNTLLTKDGERIVAMLQILPLSMSCGKSELSGGYISGACTDADYRNRGLMRDLLNEAFNVMKEKNMVFSALIPAVSGFYEKFGYEFAFHLDEITYEIKSISHEQCNDVYVCDLSHIKKEYMRHSKDFALFNIRSDSWWKCIKEMYIMPENCGAVGIKNGYLIYEKKEDTLYIRESFYDTNRKLDKMISYLLTNFKDIKTIKQTVVSEKKPFAMIKWLHPDKRISGLGYMNLMLN